MKAIRTILKTASGRIVDIDQPQASSIHISDIALGLSRMPRFSGQTPKSFYSVAAHSLLVSDIVRANGGTISEQLQALLHDATEAFYADLPSPIKAKTRGYKALERKLRDVIYDKYNVTREHSSKLILADDIALEIERWFQWGTKIPKECAVYLVLMGSNKIRPFHALRPEAARSQFLNRFRDLYFELLFPTLRSPRCKLTNKQ